MRERWADKTREMLGDRISVQGKMLAFHAKRDGGTYGTPRVLIHTYKGLF